jgi:hypothetical protein
MKQPVNTEWEKKEMPFGTRRTKHLTLSIAGPEAKEMPLSVWGPLPVSGSISLFTQGPEANSLTLSIGEGIPTSSGAIPLYLEVPWATGSPGATLFQGEMPLSIASTSGAPIFSQPSLYISAPLIGSGIGAVPLNVATDPIPTGYPLGVIPASGFLTIAVSGANPAGVGVAHDGQTTLFIRVEETATSEIPLYIERPLAASIPLSIKSQSPSGVMSVAISGAYFQTSSTSLYVQAPTTKGLTTYTKGWSKYLE